ncbi:MAG: AAA family ATPase [Chloroflexi bacterium]|nr:AAA family ATPase [Chloroflexota bacterium]
MLCAACGTANGDDAKFCVECGARLTASCASCGRANVPGAKFCAECGTALSAGTQGRQPAGEGDGHRGSAAASPGVSADQPIAERRLVSVLFADLVGFTSLAESRDAEETRELLSTYFDRSRAVIERYGGTIEKFIGDAVMAVWGAPVAHEDDAERAVRAGLELIDAVAGMGEAAGAPLRARVGIVSGEVAVTLGAKDQGMVAGDIVNTASRVQSIADPGTVLVTETTRRATEAAIAYEPAGEHLLKGKETGVATHRAIRVLGRIRGQGRNELLEAPFVGRQAELRLIKELVHTTGEERRPRVVTLIGQGGIGKSRVAWELAKYLDGVTEVLYWHRGRCPAYGEGMSYWALAEMVRSRAEIGEGEADITALPKLQAMLDQFVPETDERAWIEPPMRELLGMSVPGGGADSRETLFAAWRTLFERISEQGTTILVFEDLQWADAGLLDFIEHLHQWARNRPILVLSLTRPELLDRRPGWGAGWRNATSIGLEPLSDDVMRELLAGLVPGLPDEAVERIVERAEGIPFYAVETVRMLLADGLIEPAEGVYRPVGDLSLLAAPETIQSLVAARLDGLDAQLRQLIGAASVLGKSFSLSALADLVEQDPGQVEMSLKQLVRKELLTVDDDPRSPEHGQYAFLQSLVREVALNTLSRRDRRRLHLAAARHFEVLGDDELAGVLAGHYLDAYRAQPDGPEGEAVAAQARVALRAAADRAISLGSYHQAAEHLKRALDVARDDADRAELAYLAGHAAWRATQSDEAEGLFAQALELYRAIGDRRASLRAIVGSARAMLVVGKVEPLELLLQRAAEEYADLEGTVEHLDLAEITARQMMRQGKHAESLAWCDRGLASRATHESPSLVCELLVTRGTVVGAEGRGVEAVAILRGVLAVAEDHGLSEVQVRTLINLGFVTNPDDPRIGFAASRQGMELALHLGLAPYLPFLSSNLVDAALHLGRWDEAIAVMQPALELNISHASLALIRSMLVDIAAARGEPTDAYFDESTALDDDPQGRAGVQSSRAAIALAQGQYSEAIERARNALDTFGEAVTPMAQATIGHAGAWTRDRELVTDAIQRLEVGGGRLFRAVRSEMEAVLAALEGRLDEAHGMFAALLQEHEAMGTAFQGAMCQISMVAVLPVDSPERRRAADGARAALAALRATPYLDQLDAILARTGHPSPVSAVADAPSAERVAG